MMKKHLVFWLEELLKLVLMVTVPSQVKTTGEREVEAELGVEQGRGRVYGSVGVEGCRRISRRHRHTRVMR